MTVPLRRIFRPAGEGSYRSAHCPLWGRRWSEVDPDAAKTITIPATRSKNHTEHVVPLSDRAITVLKVIPRRAGRDYVFGVSRDGGFSNWSRAKLGLDGKLKFKTDWTVHDIRRKVRTGLGMLGIQPHIAEAVLNHLPAKLIRTYDRNTYEAEKKAALNAWANHWPSPSHRLTGPMSPSWSARLS